MQSLPMTDPPPITLERLRRLEAAVLATVGDENVRLARLMRTLVSHAHGFVRDTISRGFASPRQWRVAGERSRTFSRDVLVFRGRVTNVEGTPLAGAIVDVWHADDNGHYDSQDRRQPAGNLRGLFTTNVRGEY
jgi:hypothetical protein